MSDLGAHPAVEALLDDFYSRTGIFFGQKRAIVSRRIEEFFASRGMADPGAYLSALRQDEKLYQALTNLLTVNETYFFREARTVEIFARHAKACSGRIGVLCLPCSTGEEAYTLSIALQEAGLRPSEYTIVAADINSDVLVQAQAGRFGLRSLYRTPEAIRDRYFEYEGAELYRVKNLVREPISFAPINLFGTELGRYGPFDFIFCRNLLIYFDQASRIRAELALSGQLRPGGYLFMGHADLIRSESSLGRHFDQGVLYYRKTR